MFRRTVEAQTVHPAGSKGENRKTETGKGWYDIDPKENAQGFFPLRILLLFQRPLQLLGAVQLFPDRLVHPVDGVVQLPVLL